MNNLITMFTILMIVIASTMTPYAEAQEEGTVAVATTTSKPVDSTDKITEKGEAAPSEDPAITPKAKEADENENNDKEPEPTSAPNANESSDTKENSTNILVASLITTLLAAAVTMV